MEHDVPTRPSRSSAAAASEAGRQGLTRYIYAIQVVDVVVIVLAVTAAALIRFQGDDAFAGDAVPGDSTQTLIYLVPALVVAWCLALHLSGAYDRRFVGFGTPEYASLSRGTVITFSAFAIVSYAFKLQLSRGFILLALPWGWFALLFAHWLGRMWLGRQRKRGRALHRVLVVGDQDSVRQLIRTLHQQPEAGYAIVGACSRQFLESDTTGEGVTIEGVPVYGHELQAAEVAEEIQADVVACARSAGFGSLAVRKLSWRLEGSDTEVIVVPDVIDVAGPRITTRPINGVPLLLIEQPRFGGINLAIKTVMDKSLTFVGLIVAAPIMLAIAIAIKLDDGGPVIFRQERVGVNGERFEMLKFRSMRVGADLEHAAMMKKFAEENAARGPMFKLAKDPRVTRVGEFTRRTSLDELPQLWNILKGDMSLVGPRPPLPSEAESYDSAAMRRLLVKPGLTGMWQVSGRSNLSWEESVRLDLYYVENWSLIGDVQILLRTVKTVLAREGAY